MVVYIVILPVLKNRILRKQEKPFMQLGKRSWMACWRDSGDIQLPNCPLTPSFPLGTASWRFEVTTKVRLSTRATSTGSVRANQLPIYNDVRENDKNEMNRITQTHDISQVLFVI